MENQGLFFESIYYYYYYIIIISFAIRSFTEIHLFTISFFCFFFKSLFIPIPGTVYKSSEINLDIILGIR